VIIANVVQEVELDVPDDFGSGSEPSPHLLAHVAQPAEAQVTGQYMSLLSNFQDYRIYSDPV
jgi:hypothetical protein